jgi:hypothetical protein
MAITYLVLLLALLLPPENAQVSCHGTGAAQAREFVLERVAAGGPWRLAYRDAEHRGWVRLALPGASPTIADGTAHLAFKNANGGRQVTLDVAPDGSHIDVYVDYGLDVNIEPDLDPDVDRMNTDGPLAVACTVTVK